MGTGGRILAVLEDGFCREDSVRYAFELAKRLRGGVEVLILYPSGPEGHDPTLQASLQEVATKEGIRLRTFVKHGDKASELVKHMATHQPIDMLVWGGDERALHGSRRGQARHWFGRVRAEIACPVVTAKRKSKTT